METFRRQRSPLADRFLGLFAAAQRPAAAAAPAGDELHEDDVFWVGSDPPSSDPISHGFPQPAPPTAAGGSCRSPTLSGSGSRRVSRLSSGMLAALSEDHKRPHAFHYRKVAFAASSPSAGASPSASARMIPAVSKPKLDYSRSMPSGAIYQQSAPVNVPAVPPKVKKWWEEIEMQGGDWDRDENEMLPPHEIVARASGNGSPMVTFSVLEGIGRTLKGRDLRQVRNAVLQKTGFLD